MPQCINIRPTSIFGYLRSVSKIFVNGIVDFVDLLPYGAPTRLRRKKRRTGCHAESYEFVEMDRFTPYLGTYSTVEPGQGVCPTGVSVDFDETFSLQRVDDWIRYDQIAVSTVDGRVLHHESGVFRTGAGNTIELALVMNSGRMEFGKATWSGRELRTHSELFFNDCLGVHANERRFAFDRHGCHKELWLATRVWSELTRHMWGTLVHCGDEYPIVGRHFPAGS